MMAAHDDCIIIDAGIVGWAWMLFAEQPGLMAVLGGGLILFAVFGSQIAGKRVSHPT